MAKRKKSYKRTSGKCPEPFNTLIDLAGLAAFNHIMRKRIQNSGNERRQPYAAPMRDHAVQKSYRSAEEDSSFVYKNLDNRYAWRLNCEDGRIYGVFPQDYETKAMYDQALQRAKAASEIVLNRRSESDEAQREKDEKPNVIEAEWIGCRVSCLSTGENIYCRTENDDLKAGDMVTVDKDDGTTETGVVLSVERYSGEDTFVPGGWVSKIRI